MRSTRFLFVALCAILLFGTAFYFALTSYRRHEELKPSEEPIKSEVPISYEINDNVNKEEPLNDLNLIEVEPNKTENEEKQDNYKMLGVISFTDKEDDIVKTDGSLFIKSFLKNMKCVVDPILPYSASCCGVLSLAEDGSEDHHACILMDMYATIGSDEYTYRLRFVIEKHLVIYEETRDHKCGYLKQLAKRSFNE